MQPSTVRSLPEAFWPALLLDWLDSPLAELLDWLEGYDWLVLEGLEL